MLFMHLLVATVAVSPVQKVIQLLDELKGKVEADLSNEEKMMEEYTAWCDEEANDKEDAITSSKRTIGDLEATIEDAKATIGSLTSKIGELTQKISGDEAELAKATDLRNKESADYLAAEKELVDTVDSLERATSVLKKNLGLVQGGRVASMLQSVAGGLSKIVEASWVNAHQKQVIQSLLQQQASDGDEDLSLQPQATTAAYASQSSGILDTIADMQGKAEESLSSTRKDEMEAAHSYAMLKQGLEDGIAVAKKALGESTLQKSTTEEELHAAEAALSETQTTLAADQKYLEELKQSCEAKQTQWAQRQKQAGEETAAIEKAKEILSEGVKVLLQTSVSVRSTEEDRSRAEAVKVLSTLAKEVHSFELVQIAARARSDPFGKIRGLIEDNVGRW
jgi:chromosome segregation ATPase